MQKFAIGFMVSMVAFCSCVKKEDRNYDATKKYSNVDLVAKLSLTDSTKNSENGNCSFVIVNDSISNNILNMQYANKKGISFLFESEFSVDKSTKNSTAKVIRCKKSFIVMTSVIKNQMYYQEAVVQDNCIKLYKGISIGMFKKDFLNLVKEKYTECDSIVVTPLERNSTACFIFSDNMLKRVRITNFLY